MTKNLFSRSLTWLGLLLLTLSATGAWAQSISITAGNLTYTQDFNTLANSGTANSTLPTGFFLTETGGGARDNEQYGADTGGSNTADTYSYGSSGSTERAFGGLRSGTLIPVIGALFTNNTGTTVTSLSITYTGEQWRLGTAGRTDQLDFQYSLNATDLTTGTWVDVNALDFATPNTATTGAKDGNAVGNRTLISSIISNLSIANGATVFIRFTDFDASGADDGLAIDDLTVTATTAGPPPAALVATPTSLTGSNGLSYTQGGGPASAPISVSGSNLNTASGNVNASSSSSDFTVSPTQAAFTGSALAATNFTVQLNTGLSAGTYSTTVTFEGGGATAVVPVSGTVTAVNTPPTLTINDVTQLEGNSGTTNATFTVSLSTPAPAGGVTFDITTADGTASAGSDYATNTLTGQSIPAGSSTYTFTVSINGDTDFEATESFSVVVSNVVGANLGDGVGIGTITNDDTAPATRIHDIQGPGHISPIAGQTVSNVIGIVTTLRSNGFWMQDPNPDADDNTSEGIFVFTSSAPTVNLGDALQVNATVQELRQNANNLSSTQLISPSITVVSSGNSLPAPVVISSQAGSGVRVIPTSIITNDYPASGDVELSTFDPAEDGLDFFETLEGMRVQINSPVTSGFRNNFGEVFVIADGGAGATGFNSRKTITISGTNTTNITAAISNSDFNPERIQIDDVLYGIGNTPDENPGTVLSTIIGVVNYDFQSYEVLPSVAPTVVTPSTNVKEVSPLAPTTNQLTIASFNVENLAGNEPQTKYDGLAAAVVNNLRSPDIIALEEIQDNNGATNDGVVDATTTLNRLVSAITTAGGPSYQYRQINPVNNQDGGQTGGNIRVGFLFNPARVTFVDRPGGGSTTNTTVSNVNGQPRLSASPGRILDINPSENDSYPGDDFTSTRKPLVGEFTFNGETIFAIVNHFSSRGGSDPLTGRFQPPVQGDQSRREEQGKVVNAFIDQLLDINPNSNVVVMGDFNEFQFLPALQYLKGNVQGETPVLTNLIESLPVEERYTYLFDGNAQALDYILASNALNSKLDAFDAVHINAEFKDQLSDHDPSVARFTFAAPVTALTLVASANPSSILTTGSTTLSATVSGGTAPFSYTFSGPGTISPSGNTATVSGLSTGVQTFTITVADATVATAQTTSTTVSVNVTQANQAPVPPSVSPQSATVGTNFTFIVPAFTDPNNDALTYTASGLPANGLSFDAGTRTISGTPSLSGTVNVTITATDPGSLSASVDFAIVVSPVASTTTAPPSGSALTLLTPTYNCATGEIIFNTTGGDGTTITYMAIGVQRASATSNSGTVESGLRADPKPLTISATQSGTTVSISFDFGAFCANPGSGTGTTPPSGSALTLLPPTYDCQTGAITFNTAGGDGTTITYVAIGVQRASATSNSGTVESGLRADPKPLTISATQSGTTVSISFDFGAFCSNPGSGTGTTPPSNTTATATCGSSASTIGQSLLVTGVADVNCQMGSFRILTSGGNGSPISYANIVGLSNADAGNCVRVLDNPDLVRGVNNAGSDVQPFQLRVSQGGVVSSTYSFNFKQYCTAPARIARESEPELEVTVFGNPTSAEAVEVAVRAISGQTVAFALSTTQGKVVYQTTAKAVNQEVRQRIDMSRSAGVYLLQVSTASQSRTIKIVKQ